MLRLLAQPVFCHGDPLWWSRYIDFHFPIIKLQPGFCVNCVLQCFSCFETNFSIDVLSNFATAFMSQTTLVVESAHRLSHLLSDLLICKKPILGMSQLICSFAISSFIELQNCALFLGWPLPEMQDSSAVLFCSFSELQNIALFLGCPWSEMQSCGAILFLAF